MINRRFNTFLINILFLISICFLVSNSYANFIWCPGTEQVEAASQGYLSNVAAQPFPECHYSASKGDNLIPKSCNEISQILINNLEDMYPDYTVSDMQCFYTKSYADANEIMNYVIQFKMES